ncbi:MAG: hypothetical protein PSX37_03000 [bacterium]|nr:hypothetical protein [bacterium]
MSTGTVYAALVGTLALIIFVVGIGTIAMLITDCLRHRPAKPAAEPARALVPGDRASE